MSDGPRVPAWRASEGAGNPEAPSSVTAPAAGAAVRPGDAGTAGTSGAPSTATQGAPIEERIARARRRMWRPAIACCLLATAFRHNALAATAGLLAGAIYFVWHPARPLARMLLACTGGIFLAIVLAGATTLFNAVVAKPMQVTTPMLMHDIAGVIMHSGEPAEAASLALSTEMHLTDDRDAFLSRIQRSYDPGAAAHVLPGSRTPQHSSRLRFDLHNGFIDSGPTDATRPVTLTQPTRRAR